jgi:RND family efflux transporter MFP subunit
MSLVAGALSIASPSVVRAQQASGAAGHAPATPARLLRVGSSSAPGTHRVAGTVSSAQRATLATRIPAAVLEVRVKEGDRVEAGQVLVRLDDQDLRGAYTAALAVLETARTHEKRIRSLVEQGASTPVELEQTTAQRAQAEAAVAAARANLAYAEIRAPFASVVQAKRVNAGDLVGAGQPLVELEGSAGLEIQATVAEREGAALRIGTRLPFSAGDARGVAEVTALAPGGDPVSHRTALRARIVAGGERLRSGTFARLEIPTNEPAADELWIPRSAVVERGDLTGVFVVDGGRARLRWLSIGEAEGELVAVRAGLTAGETIVLAPGALRDGSAVTAPAVETSER